MDAECNKIMRLMVEVNPHKIGDVVTVSETCKWHHEWPGKYIVTGIQWDYRIGAGNGVNIMIASEDEILSRDVSTDGFSPGDLVFVGRQP